MKIQRFTPDEEGYIRVTHLVRPLTYGLHKHKLAFWGVVDPLDSANTISVNVVVIEDGSSVAPDLVSNYRASVLDPTTGKCYHCFDEPSKIVQGGLDRPKGLLK